MRVYMNVGDGSEGREEVSHELLEGMRDKFRTHRNIGEICREFIRNS